MYTCLFYFSEQKFIGKLFFAQKNKNWMWTELQVNNFCQKLTFFIHIEILHTKQLWISETTLSGTELCVEILFELHNSLLVGKFAIGPWAYFLSLKVFTQLNTINNDLRNHK